MANVLAQFDPSLAQQNPNQRIPRKGFFTRIKSDNGDWQKIEQIASKTRMTPTEVMQSISPVADNGSKNCGLDFLHANGVYIKSSPENGIVSTPVADMEEMDPITQKVYHSYMIDQQKVGIHSYAEKQRELKKYADAMHQLKISDSLSEVERGSILRQWVDFVNFEMRMVTPAFEAVYGRVMDSMGDNPRVVESKDYEAGALLQDRPEGTINNIIELQFVDNTVELKPQVVGVTYTRSQSLSSGFNSELLAEFQMQAGHRAMTDQVQRGIKLMATQGKQSSIPNFSVNATGLIDLVMSAPRDYIWTTVLGDRATIAKYMAIDRSAFYADTRTLAAGTVVGSDMYARAPLPRYVCELFTEDTGSTTVNDAYGLTTNQLLLVDARYAIDLYNWFAFEMETTDFSAQSDRFTQIRNIQTGPAERFPSKPTATKPFQVVTLS